MWVDQAVQDAASHVSFVTVTAEDLVRDAEWQRRSLNDDSLLLTQAAAVVARLRNSSLVA